MFIDNSAVLLLDNSGTAYQVRLSDLIIPMVLRGKVIGFLSLGDKKSGKFYNREDIDLLRTLAGQGAVAIENARMAEQMKNEEAVRANLARYLSPQIVDQIIKNDVKVNLGGDRKEVTVLFSDIRNFTSISESMAAEQLVQFLNEYFTEMARVIFDNQGSLDKYIGDAIVAVFGSLIPLENSAEAAVKASVEMMKEMVRLNEKWKEQYGFNMEMGIGVNTGEVFLGNIGSPERMEFTVIGDTVNTASRFSSLAKGRQILATRSSRERLGPDIPVNHLPSARVKGKAEEVEVFEISYVF
jgi:adenylate cyclase